MFKGRCVWFHLYVESGKTKQRNKQNKTKIDPGTQRDGCQSEGG